MRISTLGGSVSFTFLVLLLLSRPAQVTAAGALGTFFLLGIIVWSAATGYGIRDLTFPAFGFVILLSNLVLSGTWAWTATGLTCLTAVGIALGA